MPDEPSLSCAAAAEAAGWGREHARETVGYSVARGDWTAVPGSHTR